MKHIAVILAIICPAAITFAGDAPSTFRVHKSALMQPGVRSFDDWTFGTLVMPAGSRKGSSEASMLFARNASGDIRKCVPASLADAFEQTVFASANISLTIQGMQRVHIEPVAGGEVSIYAIPKAQLEGHQISCEQALQFLRLRASNGDASLPILTLMLEVAPENEAPGFATRVDAMLQSKGPAFQGGNIQWVSLPIGFANPIPECGSCSRASALSLMAERPGDSMAAKCLAQVFRRDGYVRTADVVKLPTNELTQLPQNPLIQSELQTLLTAHKDCESIAGWLVMLSRYGCSMPLPQGNAPCSEGASVAFQEENWQTCLVAALPKDSGVPNASAWNLSSVCLRKLGAPQLAILSAKEAQCLDPTLGHAVVNELLAYQDLGDRNVVSSKLVSARAHPSLDTWDKARLDELENWIKPPSQVPTDPGLGSPKSTDTTTAPEVPSPPTTGSNP